LRILFLSNYYYLRGGAERVLFEELRILRKAGHEVEVYSRDNTLNKPSKYDGYFPPEIETSLSRVSFKALQTVKEMIYSTKAQVGLEKVLKDFKPDIAHAHNIYGRLSLSVLDTLNKHEIPTVLTLHDYKILCPSYLMLNNGEICERCMKGNFTNAIVTRCHKDSYLASMVYAFESWFNHRFRKYHSVSMLVSPSRFLRNKVIQFGWDPSQIVHIPNFIDGNTIRASTVAGKYFLYLGRLSHEKGIRTLLDAIAGLTVKVPLMVVGDGPMRGELEDLAQRTGMSAKFTGYLSGAALSDSISNARAIVMPSEWYENAPLSLLEAFAYGKPVLGARIGGIPEMIDDDINGYLFEPGRIDNLQEKILLMSNLPETEIIRMGKNAREKVERKYSAEIHYERLLKLYKETLRNI